MENEGKGRQWRIGTWTMGAALLVAGIAMIAGQISEAVWLDRVWLWWPLLAVMLGVEIIVYLKSSGQPNPIIRYDLFSIVVIGAMGGLFLLLSGAQATGILDETQYFLKSERKTIDIAPIEAKLDGQVKRIVVQAEDGLGSTIRIDSADSAQGAGEVTVFGACRISVAGEAPEQLQLAGSRTVGETLYVSIRKPAEPLGFDEAGAQCSATVVLPTGVPAELATGWNKLILPGNRLPQGWSRSEIIE